MLAETTASAMLEGRTIAVVVPAYNEARLIGATLGSMPTFVDRLIVVDDGSVDETARIARRFSPRVELVEHARNCGVGAAVASGCRRAEASGVDLTVVMGADAQMDPADLPSLLRPLLDGSADFTKGNRFAWPAARRSMPALRWLGNHLFSWATRLALGAPFGDSQCGYVAMNRWALSAVPWEHLWPGYGYPNDLLSQLTLAGSRVVEVPVRPVYGEERSGIRARHVLAVIPFVVARAWVRRAQRSAIPAPWPTSTSSTAMPTASARSPSSATPSRAKAP